MSQKRKTPKHLYALIQRHIEFCDCTDELIRVKATVPVENQAQHVRDGTPEFWIARAEGYGIALDTALKEYGCYAGFIYMSPRKSQRHENGMTSNSWLGVKPGDAEFAEWRRHYFTNGLLKG